MIEINIPKNVDFIINRLEEAGYEAYAVGGCVRDSLLGRNPADWDITTSAMPEEVKKLFKITIDTGIQHGTVTVLLDHVGYEVTTYRLDGKYTDHRRPDQVSFTRNLSEDLKRRDFTINAMAYNRSKGLVDLYGGIDDLNKKIIRCVGNPDERFDEDALRIMRAVRFAAQLGFSIDSETKKAVTKHAEELKNVSAERIETELTKLLLSKHPEEVEELYDLGITAVILPEFDECMKTQQNTPYHLYDVGHHIIEVLKNVPATKSLRYAALFHDIGKPEVRTTDENGVDHFKGHNEVSEKMAGKILKRLKMDNATINDVKRIVLWHDYGIYGGIKKNTLRRALNKMGPEYFDSYIIIRKADMAGQSDYKAAEKKERLDEIIKMHDAIVADNDAISLKDLKIGGKDLMDIGVDKGPMIGKILNSLLDCVMDEPGLNEKEKLIEIVKKEWL